MSIRIRSTVGPILLAAGVAVSILVWARHFDRVGTHAEAHQALSRADTVGLMRLLDDGLDANAPLAVDGNWRGDAPLHLAAMFDHADAGRLLLERGADVNLTNSRRETPLTCAAHSNSVEVMRLLLDHGARTDVWSTDDDTPLIRAAGLGMTDAVRVLLDHGVEVDQRGREGKTALIAAGDHRSSVETVQVLLDAGADVSAVDDRGWTPLLAAAYDLRRGSAGDRQLEKIRLLLARGADVNVHRAGHGTPLTMAARYSGPALKLFLAAGADPDVADGNRRAALHIAAETGTADMVRALLDAGADPTTVDRRWSWQPLTAVEIAKSRTDEDAKKIKQMIEAAVAGWDS